MAEKFYKKGKKIDDWNNNPNKTKKSVKKNSHGLEDSDSFKTGGGKPSIKSKTGGKRTEKYAKSNKRVDRFGNPYPDDEEDDRRKGKSFPPKSTKPTVKPGDRSRTDDRNKPDDRKKYGDRNKPDDRNKYGDRNKPDDRKKFGDRSKPGEGNKYGDRHKTGDRNEPTERKSYGDRNKPGERPKTGDRNEPFERKTYGDRNKPFDRNKPVKKKKSEEPFSNLVRLNKYISNAGVCSRREADEYIRTGLVKVNGLTVMEMGLKVSPTDAVKVNDSLIRPERPVYVLMNKPKGFTCTVRDAHADKTVLDLIQNTIKERIYPVGRLDRASTGVLLLTNDGELTKRLTHPKYEKKKVYQVGLDRKLEHPDLLKLKAGIELEDGPIAVDEINYTDPDDKHLVGVEIHSGRNRIVRRMFEHIGYKVTKLDRVYFAGLTKKDLPRGRWRLLEEKELNMLKMGAFD